MALDMVDGGIEGIVLKNRESPCRDGSRAGWFKVKDRSWSERGSLAVRSTMTSG